METSGPFSLVAYNPATLQREFYSTDTPSILHTISPIEVEVSCNDRPVIRPHKRP